VVSLRDGWFHTGDMGHIDEDGYVFIDDRKKDMIIRGGENVYPREIEEVLYQHDGIEAVAVVGAPHERLGEEVAAAVVLKQEDSISADEIRDFALDKLAKYKVPSRVWFLDELPKGPTGKILKRELEPPQA
jgi:long-chain acyl-CoA synthetase